MTRGLLLACALLLSACGEQPASPLTRIISDTEYRVMPAVPGDFAIPPPRLEMPLPDEGWQPVTLPYAHLARSTSPDDAVPGVITTWYRLPLSDLQQATATPLFLYLPRWQTVGQLALYGDGELLWRSKGDHVWNGFNQPVWVPLDPLDGSPRPSRLLLRMDSTPGLGGGITRAWIGPEDDLIWQYRARQAIQTVVPLAIAIVYTALGLFGVSLWRAGKPEWMSLLFFITSLLYLARVMHLIGPLDTRLMPSEWFGWLTINSVGWLVVVSLIFNFWLCRRRFRWMEYAMLFGMLAASVATLPTLLSSTATVAMATVSYGFVTLMAAIAMPLLLWTAWRTGDRLAAVLACLNIAGMPMAIHDLLLMNYQINLERMYLFVYAEGGFFLMFWYILYRRFQQGFQAMERGHLLLTRTLAAREAELAESYRQLREVESREVLTRERQRLMQDMHDGLGASLTGALRMIEHGQCDSAALHGVLRECIEELKLTIDSLEPVEADLGLLLGTLRFRMQPRLEAAGLTLHWQISELPGQDWLTPGSALHVLRIVQEAITNIIKHAGADAIWLTADTQGAQVRVQICDNGIGLPGTPARTGRGLTNIRHRAATLGATASWHHRDDGGTCFTLLLPCPDSVSLSAAHTEHSETHHREGPHRKEEVWPGVRE